MKVIRILNVAGNSNLLDGLQVPRGRQRRQGRRRIGDQARRRGVLLLLLLLLRLDVPGRRGRELRLEHARVLAPEGHQLHGQLKKLFLSG